MKKILNDPTKKPIFITVIIAICMLSIIIPIGLLVSGCNENIETPSEPEETIYYIGDTQICGDYEVTVHSAELMPEELKIYGEYAKGRYYKVTYTVKNLDKEEVTLFDDNFKVANDNDSRYQPKAMYERIGEDSYNSTLVLKIPSGMKTYVAAYYDVIYTENMRVLFGEWGFFHTEAYVFYSKSA